MTDGFVRDDDDRFGPLTEAERSTGGNRTSASENEDVAILIPVAMVPRRLKIGPNKIASGVWPYMVDAGHAAFLVARFDQSDGSKTYAILSRWRRADGTEYERWRRPPPPLPLYKLVELLQNPTAPVLICEGEKSADRATRIYRDHIVICWQGGANAVRLTDYSPLAGRHVKIWPDNDEPGRIAASELIPILFGLGCKVDVIDAEPLSATVPGHPDKKRDPILKWDAADAVAEWPDLELLRQVIEKHTATAKAPLAYRSYGRYRMDGSGLYATPRNGKDGDTDSFVSAPFEIVGCARTPDSSAWGYLLRWVDLDGCVHTRLVSAAELHGPVPQFVGGLAKAGLRVAVERRNELVDYINGCVDLPKVISLDRTGWHKVSGRWVFVLPDAAFGDTDGQLVILTSDSAAAFASSGSLNDWAQGVGTLTRGHSRPMLMVSAAFAGALLGPLKRDGCGISIYGNSSMGKTIAVSAAASIWGQGRVGGFIRPWRVTGNGLEAVAPGHSDVILPLDEIGMVDAHDAGVGIYQLIAGEGKIRAMKDGRLQPSQSWRTFVLSTGELRLRDKLQEEGRRPMAGQLVRLLEVPADAGRGFGAFDHGGTSGDAKDLANALKCAALTSYGTAGPEFVRRLIEKGVDEVVVEAEAAIAAFARATSRWTPMGRCGAPPTPLPWSGTPVNWRSLSGSSRGRLEKPSTRQ